VDQGVTGDPAYLYWNDKKKFEKFVNKFHGGNDDQESDEEESEDEDEKRRKKEKRKEKRAKKEKKNQAEPVADLLQV
jgi:hypothetical protein